MPHFEPGYLVPMYDGQYARIEKYLAEGGQGEVYIVDYCGVKRALKWYKPHAIKKPERFYQNLLNNVKQGAPDKSFLWPLMITAKADGSFGYVMEFRPKEYRELSEFLLAGFTGIRFSSFKTAAEACIRIVEAFCFLHEKGLCYQDMNEGNFFINPNTGQVLICDCDNVSPNKTDVFIMGTPRFMAPEIVMDQTGPNSYTDRYSMAVILFLILCMNHPLEGEHWAVPCLTEAVERALYGSKPLFIYDKDDASNRPVKGVHNNCIRRWQYFPSYIQDIFQRSFSQEALFNPSARPREIEFLRAFIRFQSEIVTCPHCGNEIFIQDSKDTVCDACRKIYTVERRLVLPKYTLAAVKNTRVFRCQLELVNMEHALDPVGTVLQDSKGRWGIVNLSGTSMIGYTRAGEKREVKHKEFVPLLPGIRLHVQGSDIIVQ